MASKICIQSSVEAHPQSGFNNWQNFLHAQLKPKLVLRKMTTTEREVVHDHMKVFASLFSGADIKDKYRRNIWEEIHYINLGLNQIQVRLSIMEYDKEGVKRHLRAHYDGSLVRLDRNGDASQITEEEVKFYTHVY